MEQLTLTQLIGYLLGSGFFGSIITLIAGKFLDHKKSKKDRQLWIFRDLMANRNNRLSPNFVTAVNLIALDFYGKKNVTDAWKTYHNALSSDVDKNSKDSQERFLKQTNDSLAHLLKEIGFSLGYKMDKLDLLNGTYTPVRWFDDYDHIRKKEQLLLEILENKRSLKINITDVI